MDKIEIMRRLSTSEHEGKMITILDQNGSINTGVVVGWTHMGHPILAIKLMVAHPDQIDVINFYDDGEVTP